MGRAVEKRALNYAVTELMEDGGFERRQTVMTSLGRLEEAGWLHRLAGPQGGKSILRAITMPSELKADAKAVASRRLLTGTPRHALPINHDAFTVHGLGKTGYFILDALYNTAGTATGLNTKGTFERRFIVARTGFSAATINRQMSKLVEVDAVVRVGKGWRLSDGLDLDGIAKSLGTLGAGERIRELVKSDRDEQEEWRQSGRERRRKRSA